MPQKACMMVANWIEKTLLLCHQPNFIAMAKNMIKTVCGTSLPMAYQLDFACPDANESAADLIARAQAGGAYVSLAHPEWYTMTTERGAAGLGG